MKVNSNPSSKFVKIDGQADGLSHTDYSSKRELSINGKSLLLSDTVNRLSLV